MQNQAYSRRGLGRLLGGASVLSVLALVGCATPPAPQQTSGLPSGLPSGLRSAKSLEDGGNIATYALSLVNRPYIWGGHEPMTGFDCSGLVSHVYQQAAGINLRGSAAAMAKASRSISTTEVLAGDLVFFNTLGKPFSHIGIYVGDNKFVHSSNPRTGVRVDRLDSKYYADRFEGAKTLLT